VNVKGEQESLANAKVCAQQLCVKAPSAEYIANQRKEHNVEKYI